MSDEILNLIHKKVEKIAEDVTDLKTSQAVMQLDVSHHVKRSDMLEDLVGHLDEYKIQPLQKEMAQIKGGYKLLGAIGLIISIVLGILKFFRH